MNSTNAELVIIHALWPGPGPAILVFGPCAALLMYASTSARRCSTLGVCWACAAAPQIANTAISKIFIVVFLLGFEFHDTNKPQTARRQLRNATRHFGRDLIDRRPREFP